MNRNLPNKRNLTGTAESGGTANRHFAGYKTVCTALILLCFVLITTIAGIRPAAADNTPTPTPTVVAYTPTPTPSGSMEVESKFVFLESDGSRGVPFDIEDTKFEISIAIKDGDMTLSETGSLILEISGQEQESTMKAKFSGKLDLTPGKYSISVSGLPETVKIKDYGGDPEKYKLSVKGEINVQDGDTVIVVYLIFTDRTVPEEHVVRDLPEDEIGSYWIYPDGTKVYLLFHTYDICMAWLGSDELCRGPERCYHK